ncbi:MAG: cysteine desulfurase-like protein [Planctomycetia bacterium]|nr:cysteine desulfurase-like protein [Planctomycetia bacterium]
MLDVLDIRSRFPALQRFANGKTPVFLDGPGGTQVPLVVIEAITDYLTRCNANTRGGFTTSRETDVVLRHAHEAVADLLNASFPEEIVFGQNMTTLALHLSRSLGRTWKPGEPVVVTRLDHDANVRPWLLAAADAQAEVRFVSVREDGSLDEDDFNRKIIGAKFFALTCASNATGTMPDVVRLTHRAKEAGALVALDAVHYAPHGVIDVQHWGCDIVLCSAYKFFGPHVGILWARRDILESLFAYKVRPAPETLPGRWMTGTQNHEGVAGVGACVEYLAGLGHGSTRRQQIVDAMTAIREYESSLGAQLLSGLRAKPGVKIWGSQTMAGRAPTIAITVQGQNAADVAARLWGDEVYCWAGHFYALELAEAMGVLPQGGFVRLGLVHYNTPEEVQRVLRLL